MTHNQLKLIELIESQDPIFENDIQNARKQLGFDKAFENAEQLREWNMDWFKFGSQLIDKETVIESLKSITELQGQYVTAKQIEDYAKKILLKYGRSINDTMLDAVSNYILFGNYEFTKSEQPITLRYYPAPINRICFDITKETNRDDLLDNFWSKNEKTLVKLQALLPSKGKKKEKPNIQAGLDEMNQRVRIFINKTVKKTHLHEVWSNKIRPLQRKLEGFQEKFRPYNVGAYIEINKSDRYPQKRKDLKGLQDEIESVTGKIIRKNTIRTIRRRKRKTSE